MFGLMLALLAGCDEEGGDSDSTGSRSPRGDDGPAPRGDDDDVAGGGGGGGGGGGTGATGGGGGGGNEAQWWECYCESDFTTTYYYWTGYPWFEWDFCGTDGGAEQEIIDALNQCVDEVHWYYGYYPYCWCECIPTGDPC